MGTLGTHTRHGKKPAARSVARSERPHPADAKLAAALKKYKEAVEQQAATAEVLRAMSKSPGDAQPVFEAIVDNAHGLCEAAYTVLYRYDGKLIYLVAAKEVDAKVMRAVRGRYPQPADPNKMVGRTVLEKAVFHTADIYKDSRFPAAGRAISRRAVVCVPLIRKGAVLGVISCGRAEARAFTKREIWLLTRTPTCRRKPFAA
jgi:two-component system, NtrC family, sensor kinase